MDPCSSGGREKRGQGGLCGGNAVSSLIGKPGKKGLECQCRSLAFVLGNQISSVSGKLGWWAVLGRENRAGKVMATARHEQTTTAQL